MVKDQTLSSKTCLLTDITVPTDRSFSTKGFGKLSKYKNLEIEISSKWESTSQTIFVVADTLRIIKKDADICLTSSLGNQQSMKLKHIKLRSTTYVLRKFYSI